MGACCGGQSAPSKPKLSDKELSAHPAVRHLRKGDAESVIVLVGAGISVSAGIPDFRSPGTGLYHNLQDFKLPYPQAMFDLEYFRAAPQAFTVLAKELWPTNFCPTATHLFVRLLEEKGMLLRHYTQNIDGLDRQAGISAERTVEAHGSFGSGHCIECKAPHSQDFIRERLFNSEIVRCQACEGLVKPDIVFFGEKLPTRFQECVNKDFAKAKLLLCMGTSLQVMPFAGLTSKARSPHALRVLVNRDVPRQFHASDDDLVMQGDCDRQIWTLAKSLGWQGELYALCSKHGVHMDDSFIMSDESTSGKASQSSQEMVSL